MSGTNEEKKEKCFVIMPISDQGDYPSGHFTKVYEQIIKPSVEDAGYEAYRVDENNICDTIINKIFNAIQECPMAICDLSNRNPNVLYELGLRQAYDKPVVLIQDDKTDKIFDVSGISTVFYKSTRLYEDVIEARENITNAILATKKGKVKSMAKVMKASVADFSQIEISQDDKIDIMLEKIFSEIRELKNKDQENHNNIKVINCSEPSIGDNLIEDAIRRLTFKFVDSESVDNFLYFIMLWVKDLKVIRKQQIAENEIEIDFYFKNEMNSENIIEFMSQIASKYNMERIGKIICI